MGDFSDIYQDLRRLRDDLEAKPLDGPAQNAIWRLQELLHRTVLRIEMLRLPTSPSQIDAAQVKALSLRMDSNDIERRTGNLELARLINTRFDAVMAKLSAIEKRSSEPPQGFDQR